MRRIKFGFTLKRSANSGFTLIELLVAMGIIAVLSAGMISIIGQGPRKSANDARRFSDMNKVASVLELYRTDRGAYPITVQYCNGPLPCLATTYINPLPKDPQGNGYDYLSNGGTYTLCSTHFERQTLGVNGCTLLSTTCCVSNP